MDRILLVECHQLLRSVLQELIAHSGFDSIVEATNPLEAVQQTIACSPQIIVLDTIIPELQGFSLSEKLRQLAPHSKIVLLLENTGAEYQEAVRASGADAFVGKSTLALELPLLLQQWQHL